MKLTSFRVKGFKNFTNEVKLENLGDINVLHGPNNVGKSNLLQAMQLFFELLGRIDAPEKRLSDKDFEALGFVRSELFNLYKPRTKIKMAGSLLIEEGEIEQDVMNYGSSCEVEVELKWEGTHVDFRIVRIAFSRGHTADLASPDFKFVAAYVRAASRVVPLSDDPSSRFALIPALRPIDHQLALELYDAKESTDAEAQQRWNRFVEAMKLFSEVLGEGSIMAIYERKLERANLLLDTDGARILIKLLGSAIQQVAMLIGHLLMTKASIVAIEEPELNLKYDLQLRLRKVFAEIVGKPGGPSQLFLTSHSPAFESGSHFYFMTKGPDGPTVERMENRNAMTAVGFPADWEQLPKSAAQSYISTDGVVRLPKRVLGVLQMPHGGGVLFIDGDRSVEMMSNERFIERLGLEDGDGSED